MVLKYHPDVNKDPGATEKFKEISAAYEVCEKDIIDSTILYLSVIAFWGLSPRDVAWKRGAGERRRGT